SLTFIAVRVHGDEGMYLPDAIAQLPFSKLAQRGLKIPATDIYNPNGVSIKDAIVIVGGGTGEFISPEGLLLTNHHVAFDALVAASDQTKDYATNGYLAHSRAEELPAKEYTVQLTQEIKDVTSDVLGGINDTMPAVERNTAIQAKIRALEAAGAHEADGTSVRILPLNEGLSYYQFTYFTLRDVRIVYAPPKAIGFYGGDPDNFEWPRHCGDFTFMRAYVGPDGKPADYNASNVPFKPKKFLPISMGGIKEGDFMMVMGYPGSTRRYRESYSVAYNQDVVLPLQIDLFTQQIEALRNAGKTDPALRIKLQSAIFSFSNALKDFEGSVLAMRRANIVEKKRAEEAAFTRWVNEDPARKAKYGDVLPTLAKTYEELLTTAQRDLLVGQLVESSDLIGIASIAQQIAVEKEKPQAERNAALIASAQRLRPRIAPALAERNVVSEREVLTHLLEKADELPAGQKIQALEKRFGNLQGEARRRAEEDFARAVVESKRFGTAETLSGLFDMSAAQLRELHDPLIDFSTEISDLAREGQARTQVFNATVARWRPRLVAGMSEMRGVKPYPDANRTLRFTYGEVKGYVPREAVTYTPFTTLSGVVEKDTGREPFNVPEKLKQLFRAKDFGPYATPDGSNVPVDFLSTTDIIGGNSGSPIMNGRGEQVGIIFDGNYEGLGNDFFFNPEKGRAISVDIRYVLFLADKFGDAGYILKELDLRNAPASLRARAAGKK
ncbi:MAG TPA: S46 family peptidase, partial [Pyrinomonadaceae bacterium]|nr:S46 family peptidase [Pyrinomonadaceae bacterium]